MDDGGRAPPLTLLEGGMGQGDPVVLITEGERSSATPTFGMHREEAVATETTWAGFVRTEPRMHSGWHHHGEYESVIFILTGTLRMESGPGGRDVVAAGPGDFLFVPKGAIHREENPEESEGTLVVFRSGRGEQVTNVDGPAPAT